MNLSQATRYGAYPSAVQCSVRGRKRILAHVVRQGGPGNAQNGFQQHVWWIVSFDRIWWEPVHALFRASYNADFWYVARNGSNDTKSFASINGCYQWLQDWGITPFEGWYPVSRQERYWNDMGSGKKQECV